MFHNKNILIISPEPWRHIFVSKHHYATHLAKKGNRVFFLNPPSAVKMNVIFTEFDGVCVINYDGFIKGLHYFPSSVQKLIFNKKFKKLQKICRVLFDVIWSFDNSVFFNFDALPSRVLKISHIVDLNQNFQTAQSTSSSDICFGTTQFIIDRLKLYNPNSFFVNHGYNYHSKNKTDSADFSFSYEFQMKALYAGNLSIANLDWKLVYDIAVQNPTVGFVFVGPNGDDFNPFKNGLIKYKKRCRALKNTSFIGKIAADHLQSYYQKSDVLLITYQEKYHKEQSNPHKLMEYLGSGRAIVATNTTEYIDLARKELIAMSSKNSDFPLFFKSVINNLEYWNSSKLKNSRKTFAEDNTYIKQIERIEALVKKHVFK